MIATRRLEQQDNIAEAVRWKMEGIAANERIFGGIAPAGEDGSAGFLGKRGEEGGVAG
jgi:hypothetical protein